MRLSTDPVKAAPRVTAESGVERQLQHADGIAAHQLVHSLVVQPLHMLLGYLFPVGPSRVDMRIVGLEGG